MSEIVPLNDSQNEKRITELEKRVEWQGERLWYGTGNLHDRVHKLEDQHIASEMERTTMKEDIAKIESVLGMNSYGNKNIISDLREMMDTIEKLKGGVISTKDFHTLMNKVDALEKRGEAHIKIWDYVKFAIIGVVISTLTNAVLARLIGSVP